jgi:hypothetical protein
MTKIRRPRAWTQKTKHQHGRREGVEEERERMEDPGQCAEQRCKRSKSPPEWDMDGWKMGEHREVRGVAGAAQRLVWP